MAGESPDRSKQRESSAEPTSGSAGPVPGARSESADPRLAMARETKRSSARGGSADTATRVLSVRTDEEPESTRRDAEADADASADAGTDTGTDADADAARDTGSGDRGDGRLRDAVAAWVATADDDRNRSGGGDRGEDDAPEDAAGGTKGADRASEDAEDTEGPDAGSEDARGVEGSDAGSEDAEAADEPLEGGAEARDGQEARSTSSEGGQKAADAASKGARSDAEGEGPEADGVTADASETSEASKASKESADEDEADSDADADADDNAAEPDTQTKDEVPESADEAATGKATDSKPADAGTTGKAAPTKSDTAKTDTGKADAKTAPAPAAGTDGDGKADRKADTGPAPDADGDGEGDGEGDGDGDGDGTPAAPPVDQPTAVFKTVRPPVDQPTTMLKLGGGTKDAPKDHPTDVAKDAPKDAPKGGAEKEAERTSKFVALKPLDDPATRKPASGEGAAQAAPPADATAPVPTVGPERTTQQPLPPKPPLDLLAELTNTPPPPETPLRTAVRRVKIWTPLVLLLVIVFAVVQSVRPLPTPTLELTAKDSYTFEGGKVDIPWPTEGQAALDVQGIGTFGSSGEQKPVPIASVAKVMTAYVILRGHPLKSGEKGPEILIDQAAEDQSDAGQESTVDVTEGDKITEREALESILIASANNVARLLARWDAGSEKAFVQKMNDAAKDLGMKNTTYTDPSGLNNTTVSTAVDQVKLAKAAMQQPAFREVAAMMSYVDYKQKKHDNWNRLVGSNNVVGIKTGTTTSALGNLVFAAKKDVDGETRRIVGAVVRQPAGGPDNTILGAALYEGDKLIRAAQDALETATILKKGEVVGYADDGLGGRTPVAVTEDVTAVGWAGLSVKLTFAPDELPHEAKAGTKVGTLTVGDGSTSAVKVPVALQEDLVEPGLGAKLTRIG
ncbi:D-alanyl-D-alanine carboxypeptidase [Streptomyces sp. NPDC006624]|uniref:D-alanyl-D-alanine carboxypeptidase n=1 Tax=Streptomyces sp. NPDC006624 TaxID=3154892 RepID=UPI0033A7D242